MKVHHRLSSVAAVMLCAILVVVSGASSSLSSCIAASSTAATAAAAFIVGGGPQQIPMTTRRRRTSKRGISSCGFVVSSSDCNDAYNYVTELYAEEHGRHAAAAATAPAEKAEEDIVVVPEDNENNNKNNKLWSRQQLEEFALEQGVVLSLSTLGPGFRVVARCKHDPALVLGFVEGFVRPSGNILHVDQMQVYKSIVQKARKENPIEFKGGGTRFGVGLLLGYLSFLHGQNVCQEAEFLAIDDEDFQHKRLVRYYTNAGFDIVKYVGDDFKDIPDRLVWGGCGTLLRAKISTVLDTWTRVLEKSVQRAASKKSYLE